MHGDTINKKAIIIFQCTRPTAPMKEKRKKMHVNKDLMKWKIFILGSNRIVRLRCIVQNEIKSRERQTNESMQATSSESIQEFRY